jgi:hypothetical protein
VGILCIEHGLVDSQLVSPNDLSQPSWTALIAQQQIPQGGRDGPRYKHRYPRRTEPRPRSRRGFFLIELPDQPPLWLEKSRGAFSERWEVAKIFDQAGETLITVRWGEKARSPRSAPPLSAWSRLGEAVLAPRQTLPVEATLFGCYALEALNRDP